MFVKSESDKEPLESGLMKQNRHLVLTAVILFLIILLISWLNTRTDWIESVYALRIYPVLASVLGFIFGWIPFSAGDVMYLLVIALLLILVFRFFKRLFKRKFRAAFSSLLRLAIVLEVMVIIFYVFWGMNYFRYSTARRLHLDRSTYDLEQLVPAAGHLITKANSYRARLDDSWRNTGNREIYRIAQQAYMKLGQQDPAFELRRPKVKPALFTPLINFMGVAGYFNPFTGESQVNYAMPTHLKPFVACHEIAHQAGFGPEDAASFAGFLAGTRSENPLLQYSVYYTAMKDVMREIARSDRKIYADLYAGISPAIKKDMDVEYRYWSYYRGPVDAISDFFYDHFLKANNQPKGLRTYNEMISLLIAYYQKQGILPE